MDVKNLLFRVGKALLWSAIGPGHWASSSDDQYEKPDDPIDGLTLGQVVYHYEIDNEQMIASKIIAIEDGIGFVLKTSQGYGPRLLPVRRSMHALTLEGAVAIYRKDIESDIRYCERKAARLSELRKLITLREEKPDETLDREKQPT